MINVTVRDVGRAAVEWPAAPTPPVCVAAPASVPGIARSTADTMPDAMNNLLLVGLCGKTASQVVDARK
ncbi:hypothetical protein GCM10022206_06410 [Streptomyces chiangmaiensis]